MITIGTDPELFLRDKRTGAVASAVGLIGGTKSAPLPMEKMREGYAVQEDNVMVEFNIPPVGRADRFASYVDSGLMYISNLVRTSLENYELDRGSCSRLFSEQDLANKQAEVFGCSPDFNAHRQGEPWPVISPDSLREENGMGWRFAGGHVHIGYTSNVPDFVAAAFADALIGLSSVQKDEQGKRRSLYGQAGRYRPTAYGIEYRTLSNYWIWDVNECAQVGRGALALGHMLENTDESKLQTLYAEVPWSDVQAAINNEDVRKAADLVAYLSNDLNIGGM